MVLAQAKCKACQMDHHTQLARVLLAGVANWLYGATSGTRGWSWAPSKQNLAPRLDAAQADGDVTTVTEEQ